MIKAAPGMAFIIENREKYGQLERMGLALPDDAQRGVGSVGIIHSVTHEREGLFPRLRHWLFAERIGKRYEAGQVVIYDKFIASDVYYRDAEGNELVGLRSVPIDCILGTIE